MHADTHRKSPNRKIYLALTGLSIVGMMLACQFSGNDQAARLTDVAIAVEQTRVAESQATASALATQIAQSTPTVTPLPEATVAPSVAPSNIMVTEAPISTAASPEDDLRDFENWKSQANILLFEDMVSMPRITRYVKTTLLEIGLPFEDVGNATGRLKERLVVGTEQGEPWDLVIVAIEARSQVSGELFDYIHGALEAGASVVIEEWMLDRIFKGKVKDILEECGVQVGNYYAPPGIRLNYMLEPLDATHPILNEPNDNLDFKEVVLFWSKDVGDLMYLTGTGDAQILLNQIAAKKHPKGVLAVCIEDRLILQTFSSHNYPIEMMAKVWENYIHNALLARYRYIQEQKQ